MNKALIYIICGGLQRDIESLLKDVRYTNFLGEKIVTQQSDLDAAIVDLKASQTAAFKAVDDKVAALQAKVDAGATIDLSSELADIKAVTQANLDKAAAEAPPAAQ